MAHAQSSHQLSTGEMEFMDLLWTRGPLSLCEAHESFGRDIGYTTVQTRLNRLVDKGLVTRTDDRPAKYVAAVAPAAVSAGHLAVLVQRVAGGSIVPLVAQLVASRPLPPDEIAELKKLIADAEKVALTASGKKA
ncbi:MAG: hypothetical protein A3K19_16580 [Lentisphaerae bacterium RIFOXYB12_FULL_65_16]|nr:MAG: hypothetical protein A3K18_24690 [Lentisphaerae bacterium RIFOXYA12_64_32]OGV89059.1 MAG: hypothetical protein A3K19_16580 [Lentisphaerae bacterium RIFOXYB12_FULL_65_16]